MNIICDIKYDKPTGHVPQLFYDAWHDSRGRSIFRFLRIYRILITWIIFALRLEASAGYLCWLFLNRVVPAIFGFLLVIASETHSTAAARRTALVSAHTARASAYIVPPLSGFMRAVYGRLHSSEDASSDATSSASSYVPRDGSNDRLAALVDSPNSQVSSGQDGPPTPSHAVPPFIGFMRALYGRRVQVVEDASSNLARDGSNDRLALLVDPA